MMHAEVRAEALARQEAGNWPAAEKLYRQLLSESPVRDAVVLANLGQVLRRQERHDEALALYREALAQGEPSPALCFNYGNALFDRGDWKEAVDAFQQALALDEAMEGPLLQRARCAVKLGDLSLAREYFAALLRAWPQNFSGWLEAGNVCRKTGPEQQMLASYRRAVAVAPQRWAGHASLAAALELAGQREEGALHYYQALGCADAGNGVEVHNLIGRYRMERGAGRTYRTGNLERPHQVIAEYVNCCARSH